MTKRFNKYGDAAILAASMQADPVKAWEKATFQIFKTKASREKGCPKNVFLGLCEEGLVKGAKRGNYSRSLKNKEYALEALEILSKNRKISKKELWDQVCKNLNLGDKRHNSQMDVVLALWYNNLIQ